MAINWPEEIEKFRLTARENDLVLVEAPADSMAARYNGQQGYIIEIGDEWVAARVQSGVRRFRPDELKIL